MYYNENSREIERISLSPHQARNLAQGLLADPDIQDARQELTADPPLPETIADFEVTRIIASGGMGTVYEARQEQPQRTVAIKVLKRHLASRSALRRFELEAELLGALQHPGIAHIYEAGTWDDGSGGVPYFVMEYIRDAMPITEYAEEHGLTIRQRLELFAKVCDAVHHGHQKGIIHRDLKPSNILVDENGMVKVIDFGVARSTDSDIAITTMHTEIGQLIGTLQYMSPEQCEGKALDIDIRSDVYSLGVVLYELLCGELPYDVSDTSIPSATRIIQDLQPGRPSAIQRRLHGDIETIILKALEKEPERRYQSAAELGADAQRWLHKEPIAARPETLWFRTIRWIGRHPVASTAAASLLVIALSAIGTRFTAQWYVNHKPFDVTINDDQSKADLLSISGKVLFSWPGGGSQSLRFARLLSLDAYPDPCVLIEHKSVSQHDNAGALALYAVTNPEEAIWTGRITDRDLARSPFLKEYEACEFGPQHIQIANFFPETPDPEILVSFSHARSSIVCVRIYDFVNKQPLFQFWHDGTVNSSHWIPSRGRLVLTAHNNEATWAERGYDGLQNLSPIVCIGLSPKSGNVSHDWLRAADEGVNPVLAWYQCLQPVEAADIIVGLEVRAPDIVDDNSECFRLNAWISSDGYSGPTLSWLVDADGTFVNVSGNPNDVYAEGLHTNAWPKLDELYLKVLPPVLLPQNRD